YQYAVQQSGFDPRTATYQPDPSVVQTYRQAQGNCLSSRGYQVSY
ncbi:glycine zipper family protein, partial [Pseudomonas sp. HMWF031]